MKSSLLTSVFLLLIANLTPAHAAEAEAPACNWAIAVAPTQATSKDPLAKVATGVLNSLLIRDGWNVVGWGDAKKTGSALGGDSGDAVMLAMSGIDVVVVFSLERITSKDEQSVAAAMRLVAKKARTNILLASVAETSASRPNKSTEFNSAVQDATEQAGRKLLKSLRDACIKERQEGKAVRVVIGGVPRGAEIQAFGILRKSCKKARQRTLGPRKMVVECKTTLAGSNLAEVLGNNFSKAFSGKKIEWTTVTNDLLDGNLE
ncbi:MAG: hypothetical protein D6806_16330 [Deltaproteobacteria bacterium]|nr:MAG: hypothetical protein D6806_16330 [Deltaproteobacteria bacterium]